MGGTEIAILILVSIIVAQIAIIQGMNSYLRKLRNEIDYMEARLNAIVERQKGGWFNLEGFAFEKEQETGAESAEEKEK